MKKLFILILFFLLYPMVSFAEDRLAKYGVEYILNFELFEVDGVDFRINAADGGADSRAAPAASRRGEADRVHRARHCSSAASSRRRHCDGQRPGDRSRTP
ncbi:hypothetical protein LCGC14_3028380 [marine sediment metagenome]|uniref:Uncharacterized protein n=1 Tax=marine sediment metagenome TaxID=412755 RepID=A0A0F8WT03_9ZZZZ